MHLSVARHIKDILRRAKRLLFLNLQLFGLVYVSDCLQRERFVAVSVHRLLHFSRVLEMLGFHTGYI